MSPFRSIVDRWLGRGEAAITVPPMDGALRPNDTLDAAAPVLAIAEPDGLALTARGLVVSAGRELIGLDPPATQALHIFDAEIGAITGLPDGGLAVGLADGRIRFMGGAHDGRELGAAAEVSCITALAPAQDNALLVANGSARNPAAEWPRDLMAKGASGSVWRVDPRTGARQQLADGMAYPCGLLDNGASIVVSESWRSALTRIAPGGTGARPAVLDDLPAYPCRLSSSADGAIWLALFAPRSQLVEFVLTEDRYRRRMMAGVDPACWIAPSLRAGRTPQAPTRQGGVRQLGILKPWAPSLSYGLVLRLDASFRPKASFHSRANGHRHGVTACLTHAGRLWFCAKGDGIVGAAHLLEDSP